MRFKRAVYENVGKRCLTCLGMLRFPRKKGKKQTAPVDRKFYLDERSSTEKSNLTQADYINDKYIEYFEDIETKNKNLEEKLFLNNKSLSETIEDRTRSLEDKLETRTKNLEDKLETKTKNLEDKLDQILASLLRQK